MSPYEEFIARLDSFVKQGGTLQDVIKLVRKQFEELAQEDAKKLKEKEDLERKLRACLQSQK